MVIHIDIRHDPDDASDCPKLLVQTSTDGGGWATQYVIYAQNDDIKEHGLDQARTNQENHAADTARVFANGCRYAGAETRLTMFGYAI